VSGTLLDPTPHDDREMLLLVECARASVDAESAARVRGIVAAGLNWDRLLTLARRHGLAPLLYCHLRDVCASSVPAESSAALRDYVQKNGALAVLLAGELVRLLELLEASGITAIPYKGPALAVRLYGHVTRRQFGDLDILVRRRDVWEAGRVLEAQGFEPVIAVPETSHSRFVRQTYVRVFHRDAGRTVVELHWSIAEPYWAVRFDAEAMWPRLERMPLLNATVSMPCAEDLLLLLCVHSGRHGADKLEGPCSIAELLRQTPDLDWEQVWRRAGEMHCRRLLEFGLLLAHGVFDARLPVQAEAVSRSRALLAMARRSVRDFSADEWPVPAWTRRVAAHLRLKDSRADQVRYCGRVWMSTPEDWAGLRLPESLAFVYPLVRAARLARK
jgi:Uncharacterised nucleotidyltransferase